MPRIEACTRRVATFSSPEFNQNTQGAKKAAEKGPVFITRRGKPEHVLLTMEEYLRITGQGRSIVDILAMPDGDEIAFDPPRLSIKFAPADLS